MAIFRATFRGFKVTLTSEGCLLQRILKDFLRQNPFRGSTESFGGFGAVADFRVPFKISLYPWRNDNQNLEEDKRATTNVQNGLVFFFFFLL